MCFNTLEFQCFHLGQFDSFVKCMALNSVCYSVCKHCTGRLGKLNLCVHVRIHTPSPIGSNMTYRQGDGIHTCTCMVVVYVYTCMYVCDV